MKFLGQQEFRVRDTMRCFSEPAKTYSSFSSLGIRLSGSNRQETSALQLVYHLVEEKAAAH